MILIYIIFTGCLQCPPLALGLEYVCIVVGNVTPVASLIKRSAILRDPGGSGIK